MGSIAPTNSRGPRPQAPPDPARSDDPNSPMPVRAPLAKEDTGVRAARGNSPASVSLPEIRLAYLYRRSASIQVSKKPTIEGFRLRNQDRLLRPTWPMRVGRASLPAAGLPAGWTRWKADPQ